MEAVKGRFAQDGASTELNDRILEEKTLDWLLERANLVEPAADAPTSGMQQVAEEIVKDQVKAKSKSKSKAKAKAPAKAKAKKADAAATGDADLSILKGAIGALKDALATGAHDAHLQALLDAEQSGKARKGALAAIQARMS